MKVYQHTITQYVCVLGGGVKQVHVYVKLLLLLFCLLLF